LLIIVAAKLAFSLMRLYHAYRERRWSRQLNEMAEHSAVFAEAVQRRIDAAEEPTPGVEPSSKLVDHGDGEPLDEKHPG